MGRYTDNAPIDNTCPKIDSVISFIKGIGWNLEDEDELLLSKESKAIIEVLEEIRTANSTLREWGNQEFQEKEYFEKERDEMEGKIKDLEKEIKSLEDDLNATTDAYNDCMDELNSTSR